MIQRLGLFVAGQLRKPDGWFGRLLARGLNKGNRNLNDLMVELLEVDAADQVLEIGFGNGKLICDLSDLATEGLVAGIDFSETMVAEAHKFNRARIDSGQVRIKQASVEAIPFEDDTFHKICTANTLYFWPQPAENAKEILRVLRSGGTFVLGFEPRDQLERLPFTEHGFATYTLDEAVALLEGAGFTEVKIVQSRAKKVHSYCAVASKP